MVRKPRGLRRLHGLFKKREAANAGKVAWQAELSHVIRGGAGAHGKDEVAHLHIFSHGAGRPHTDQPLHAVAMDQLVGINPHGRAAHAGSHDRNPLSFICPGKSQHVPRGVKLHGIRKKCLCNHFRRSGSPGSRMDSAISPDLLQYAVWASFPFAISPFHPFRKAAPYCLFRRALQPLSGSSGLPFLYR